MKTKLIKIENNYHLENNGDIIAGSHFGDKYEYKLSIKNCATIENGYDLDELISVELEKLPYEKHVDDGQYNDGQLLGFELGAEWGFKKALEILGDKKFSIGDVLKAFFIGQELEIDCFSYEQSLQQTEWNVEIELEEFDHGISEEGQHHVTIEPKLDSDKCLILKIV